MSKKKQEDIIIIKEQKPKKNKKEKIVKSDVDKFANDLSDFLSATAGIDIKTLSESESVPFWINSGSYALNWIISNDMFKGVPGTKAIMVSGEPEKGKSLITDVWLGENIRQGGISYKIDIEDAIGSEFTSSVVGDVEIAKKIRLISPGVLKAVKKAKGDEKKLKKKDLVITVEKLTSILNKLVDYQISKNENKTSSIMVVIDSVSQLSSDKEIEDISSDKDKRDMTAQQKMRALFRVLNQKLRHANVTLVGVAHLTTNIGVMFGPNKVISAKGSGFMYGNSLTINMMSSKEIVDSKTKVPVGIRMKMKTTKNRIAFKGRTTFLYLYFDRGIDKYGGIAELLCQYGLAKASAKAAADGSYPANVKFKYTTLDGKELVFTSAKTKQIIEENGGDDLLIEINNRLTDAYKKALEADGISEEELLESDDPETEEEFIDIEEEE